jgi:hypothetical protein
MSSCRRIAMNVGLRCLGLSIIVACVIAGPALAEGDLSTEEAVTEFKATHNFKQHRGLAVVPGVYELLEL